MSGGTGKSSPAGRTTRANPPTPTWYSIYVSSSLKEAVSLSGCIKTSRYPRIRCGKRYPTCRRYVLGISRSSIFPAFTRLRGVAPSVGVEGRWTGKFLPPTLGSMLDEKSLPKSKRSDHIQNCVRQEMVKKLVRVSSEIRYCHLCFKWVVGDEWEPHCALHLSSLTTKRCGTLSYCNTLVRPGYSPFRLGKKEESAAYRLQSWSRDFDLWVHVNDEVEGRRWPILCPHPLCDILLKGDRDLQFHFIDDHGFSRTRPGQPASADIFAHDGDDRSVKTTRELTSLESQAEAFQQQRFSRT